MEAPGPGAGGVGRRAAQASEPESPPATTWGGGRAAARAEPRRGGSGPARASAAGAPAEVGAPAAADLGECGVSVAGREHRTINSLSRGRAPARVRSREWRERGRSAPATPAVGDVRVPSPPPAPATERPHRGLRSGTFPRPGRRGEEPGQRPGLRLGKMIATTGMTVTAAASLTPRLGGTESLARSESGGHPARAERGVDAWGPGGPT